MDSMDGKVGISKTATKLVLCLVIVVRLVRFLLVLLASKSRFQCNQKHAIWIQYTKVMKGQSLILKAFLPHKYIIDFGDEVLCQQLQKEQYKVV